MRRSHAVAEKVVRRILLIRGQKVMLDSDLAALYGVPTKRLNEQVRRNARRFPPDFMFPLSPEEAKFLRTQGGTLNLRSQIATSSSGYGGRRYRPYVFTEQGVAMLSSVLNSERAIQVNIAIMRAFVRLRRMLATHRTLAQKLLELERKLANHDHKIHAIFDAIRELMAPAPASKRRIGFHAR
jgi:hypothetical protein